jgi:hypothetical protein
MRIIQLSLRLDRFIIRRSGATGADARDGTAMPARRRGEPPSASHMCGLKPI